MRTIPRDEEIYVLPIFWSLVARLIGTRKDVSQSFAPCRIYQLGATVDLDVPMKYIGFIKSTRFAISLSSLAFGLLSRLRRLKSVSWTALRFHCQRRCFPATGCQSALPIGQTPVAFDQYGVIIDTPSPENKVFGDSEGNPANFTDFSLRHRLHDSNARLGKEMGHRVAIMNPMDFIGTDKSTVAQNWYIRHGAKDRDTSFLVPINLATKLQNSGRNVDFFIPWNRPHSGDYNLDDLFRWIKTTLK